MLTLLIQVITVIVKPIETKTSSFTARWPLQHRLSQKHRNELFPLPMVKCTSIDDNLERAYDH